VWIQQNEDKVTKVTGPEITHPRTETEFWEGEAS